MCQGKKEAIEKYFENIKSTEINFIVYKKGKTQGTATLANGYSIFGTFLIILQDSDVGHLHVEGHDMPQKLQEGDCVLLDPSVLHRIEKIKRDENRENTALEM